MTKLTYEKAMTKAIKFFEKNKSQFNKEAEIRSACFYEASGTNNNLDYVLVHIEYTYPKNKFESAPYQDCDISVRLDNICFR